jgi:hypothetical protein
LAAKGGERLNAPGTLIDLHDREGVRARSPLLIAHRGGVVTRYSPENSLAAIRLAAAEGYDLVELDVVIASDDEPVLFHGAGNLGTLRGTSGGDALISGFTSNELAAIRYDGSDERIAMLDEALALCRSLGLGVMLDFKLATGEHLGHRGVERVVTLLDCHGLTKSTMTITPYPPVREGLPPDVLFPVSDSDLEALAAGATPNLEGAFWFGIPARLDESLIVPMQEAGALVIPAINRFRYPPDGHEIPAETDILRLLAKGVDGFQIDSAYLTLFPANP